MEKKLDSCIQQAFDGEKFLVLVVAPLVLLSLLVLISFIRKPFPPGPRGWPLIGNMKMMSQLNHQGLAKLAQKYGGILHLKMGYVHMVVVSSPEVAQQVLQVQDNVFSNRPVTIAKRYLSYDRADMAFANCGPFWRQMRKLCVMKLFSRRRAESWNSVRDEVDKMVQTVAMSTGNPINIRELVFRLTRDIIYRAAFGMSSGRAQAGQDEFIKILQEFSKLFGAFNLADFIPWFSWIDPHGLNNRLVKARATLDGFIDSIIDDHIQKPMTNNNNKNGAANVETNMVDELLAFYSGDDDEAKVNESEDLQSSIKLTKDNIKAIIMDVMFGGIETVATAIEWGMAELMRSPDDLEKVQQELANVVGLHQKVKESDFDKLTFLKCCLKETLRLHPPIPLLQHATTEESMVYGYHIPAKSHVLINVWAIGRHKDFWEDPESFNPSRFLQEGVIIDYNGENIFDFIPFGSGRRSCPAMKLGIYALEVAVAHLLHCFTWELPDGITPTQLDMDDIFGLTAPKATQLVAVPTPRLLCPLLF